MKRKRCYYEVLELSLTATLCQIRHSYHKLAMRWHPDKNKSITAKESFQEINEAYSILSNPSEKTWYDRHREVIVRNWNLHMQNQQNKEDNNEILALTQSGSVFPYFVRPAFLGYDDSENGFYTVHRNVFKMIKAGVEEMSELISEFEEEDNEAQLSNMIQKAPGFGTAETRLVDVARFYRYWEELLIIINQAWKDLCYTNLLKNGQLIPAEDREAREALRKAYMSMITNMVQYVKMIDPRYHKYIKERLISEQNKENKEKRLSPSMIPLPDSPEKNIVDIEKENEIVLEDRINIDDLCMECWNWAVANLEKILQTKPIDIDGIKKEFDNSIAMGQLPWIESEDVDKIVPYDKDKDRIEMEDEDISENSQNKELRNKLLGLPESQNN